ncbi:MAG: FAD-binding oxidoreductase [Proteobacteria bacterium]|nr:FAD-binding oxidoreductase [Pseudomonadota bacterium]
MLNYDNLGSAQTRSFWLNTYKGYKANPPLREDIKVDVAIIGGGFTGLSTAFNLVKQNPGINVAILEGSDVGFGASGRNGGFSMTLFGIDVETTYLLYGEKRTREAHQYMEKAVNYVKHIVDKYDFKSDYRHSGFLRIALTSKLNKRLEHSYNTYVNKLGFDEGFSWYDQEKLSTQINIPLAKSAFFEKNSGILNPAKHVREWKRIATNVGVKLYENSPCVNIDCGEKIRLSTQNGSILAEKLVLATNAYSHLLNKVEGIKGKQLPVWTYQIVTEPLSEKQWQDIGWENKQGIETNRNLLHYFRPTEDGRITFGGSDVKFSFGKSMNHDSNSKIWNILYKHFLTIFPQLKGIKIAYRWGGAVSLNTSLAPSLGYLGDKRIVYSNGCIGHGVSLTQLNGKTIADLVMRNKSELTDMWFVNRKIINCPPEPIRYFCSQSLRGYFKIHDKILEGNCWNESSDF